MCLPIYIHIIESVDSINRDERDFPLQYITNGDERGFPLTQSLQMGEYLALGMYTLSRIVNTTITYILPKQFQAQAQIIIIIIVPVEILFSAFADKRTKKVSEYRYAVT